MNRHTSSQFDQELEEIRTKILRMGGQVEEMIKGALVGFSTANRDQLNGVLVLEKEVNSAEMEIDEICNKVIAKRQPTASDLRFLVACLKMIRDLERAGDEAEKMARMALHFYEGSPLPFLVSTSRPCPPTLPRCCISPSTLSHGKTNPH